MQFLQLIRDEIYLIACVTRKGFGGKNPGSVGATRQMARLAFPPFFQQNAGFFQQASTLQIASHF